jgi:hypothetical protein
VERAELDGLDGVIDVGGGRRHHHLGQLEVLARDAERLEPADARLIDVEQHGIDFLACEHRERRLAARRPQDAVVGLERRGDRLAPAVILVDDEHRAGTGHLEAILVRSAKCKVEVTHPRTPEPMHPCTLTHCTHEPMNPRTSAC